MKKFLFLLLLSTSLSAQIDRTEPPFWFSGMKNGELQIMFYGKNLSQYETSVSNHVQIKNVIKTENPNYQFVTIDIQNVPPSELIFTFKKGKESFKRSFQLKPR
ncbi:MAG TPA: cyclomaltodextrinase N-terminal domain-containing protein, partial [Flavobacterium sp.]